MSGQLLAQAARRLEQISGRLAYVVALVCVAICAAAMLNIAYSQRLHTRQNFQATEELSKGTLEHLSNELGDTTMEKDRIGLSSGSLNFKKGALPISISTPTTNYHGKWLQCGGMKLLVRETENICLLVLESKDYVAGGKGQ